MTLDDSSVYMIDLFLFISVHFCSYLLFLFTIVCFALEFQTASTFLQATADSGECAGPARSCRGRNFGDHGTESGCM